MASALGPKIYDRSPPLNYGNVFLQQAGQSICPLRHNDRVADD